MHLTVSRHGQAHPASMSGTDRDRELHPQGQREAKFLALAMATLDTPPDAIVASPFVRAQQTALVINNSLRLELMTDDRLRCGTQPSNVLQLIEHYAEAKSLVLVGHNPTLDELIGLLTGGVGAHGPGLRTGEAYVIDLNPADPIGTGMLLTRIRLEPEKSTTNEPR